MDTAQRIIGMILNAVIFPPIIIALLATGATSAIFYYFGLFDYSTLVVGISVLVLTTIVAFVLFDQGLQSLLLGGTVALLFWSISFMLWGIGSICWTFILAQWSALGMVLIILFVVGLIVSLNYFNFIGIFKTGG